MFRLLFLLVLIGAVGCGAYLTKPTEALMKSKADAAFAKVRKEQAKDLDLKGLAGGAVKELTRKAKYEDMQVAAHYTVMDGDKEVLSCWGAFTKVMCPAPKAS